MSFFRHKEIFRSESRRCASESKGIEGVPVSNKQAHRTPRANHRWCCLAGHLRLLLRRAVPVQQLGAKLVCNGRVFGIFGQIV
jgi:hypothetical protein